MEKYIRENGSMTKCLISKRLGSRKGNYLLYHEATFTIYTQYSTYLGCPFHLNRVVQSWVKKTKWRKTEDYEDISACLPSTNRAKASRSLQFSLANIFSTTWASLFSSQPLLAGANLLSYVHGILSLTQEIGPNSQVFPHVDTTQNFCSPLTSTPSSSLANHNGTAARKLSK